MAPWKFHSRRQYFEPLGGRAIYHDGWWAGTRHGADGVTATHGGIPFDQDVWELYEMKTDFGHATDLAATHPDKLAELQALFDREAANTQSSTSRIGRSRSSPRSTTRPAMPRARWSP